MVMKLEVKGASFSYDGSRARIFENISFSLGGSDFLCILGANGCGKTTLLKCINNLLKLNEGQVLLNERNTRTLNNAEIARTIGYIPQIHSPAFPFTVFEVVLMGRSPYIGTLSAPGKRDHEIAEQALETMGIAHLRDRQYTTLSGGELQMTLFARVLCQTPSLLLLDEPTAHLDFGNQIRFLEKLREITATGLPAIMTSHYPDHAFLVANKVAIMKGGALVDFGTPQKVITEENLYKIYGIRVKVTDVDGSADRKVCIPL